MPTMPNIDEVLERDLTSEQRAAVRDPAREILCLACAGSGKSRTLAYRIARIVAEGDDPRGIVAFTFTEKAAGSIKRWVAKALAAIGSPPTVLGAMYVGTIHSYCHHTLGEMDARYRQFDVLDDNRLRLYLMSRYRQLGLGELRRERGARYFDTISQVADAWKTVNNEMLRLRDVVTQDSCLETVLTRLSQRLERDQYVDFSLMIRRTVEALRRQDTGAETAVGQLRHLMVDEYQDVNPCQEALIQELHRRSSTLFVVGDDDQSIYAWRGADVTNILSFERRYSDCSPHTLPHNFRSTCAIVRAADDFVRDELGATRNAKNATAEDPEGPRDFRKLWFSTRAEEAEWVQRRIHNLLGKAYAGRDDERDTRGLTPGDFAILMRSTRTEERDGSARHAAFTSALEGVGIEYTLEAGGGVFEQPHVSALRAAFELLRDGSPTRQEVQALLHEVILPLFPRADLDALARVFAEWGRLVHAPIGGPRRRVYPQQLVYSLLSAFGLNQPDSGVDVDAMYNLGVFSRVVQDVETVYVSIDSVGRFREMLNFLNVVARHGYDVSTDDILAQPDAVAVSTVHKAKGLEFPVVFVVDVEANRFPGSRRAYRGWLPLEAMQSALDRGAYRGTREEEARLFYTAMTRAERFLYVTGSERLPGGRQQRRESPFSQRLDHPEISTDADTLPLGLARHMPIPRINEAIVPTSYSEIRYYLKCPWDYRLRKGFGFSPAITEMFGFGTTLHTAISKIHEAYPHDVPPVEEAQAVAREVFHLKHVPASDEPDERPGPYERARDRVSEIVRSYTQAYSDDFRRLRQVEVPFEIPVEKAVISGAIDLLLRMDDRDEIMDATVIEFKALEGGEEPEEADALHWTELALQVQLYAKAARELLGEDARTGAVHLLRDNQRIQVPVDGPALGAAVQNVEWAVSGILEADFPMRPSSEKCASCDFKQICPRLPQQFARQSTPPAIHIPGPAGAQLARALSQFDG